MFSYMQIDKPIHGRTYSHKSLVEIMNNHNYAILALLIANFIYFSSLYFSDYSINYFYLLKNSIFTLIFYPIIWTFFGILIRFTNVGSHA